MPSPFPGMNPYLEQSAFWSSFHSRMIVALADTIEPQLSPQYYVEVETRTYQSDESEDEVLIGIPDAIVFSSQSDVTADEQLLKDDLAVATQARPERVSVPMPLEIKEGVGSRGEGVGERKNTRLPLSFEAPVSGHGEDRKRRVRLLAATPKTSISNSQMQASRGSLLHTPRRATPSLIQH